MNPHFIQYRGYYSGPKDRGSFTALYPTPEQAATAAKACSYPGDRTWVNPEFVGQLDTALRAKEPLDYIEWKPMPARRTIQPGETFKVGDILLADRQTTLGTIGLWIVQGRVEIA